jgi:hypothetical protein
MEETPQPKKKEDIQLKSRLNPIVARMPAHLKDPANYDKIQRTLLEALASSHSHGEVLEWASCLSCQQRFYERSAIIKKLGFESPAAYMVWKRIHETIKQRVPLPKYNNL